MVYSGFLEQKSSFVKGLPDTMPPSIKETLESNYEGSLGEFSRRIGVPYSAVYSVMVRAGQRPLETLKALATPLGLTMDEMAQILLIRNLEKRNAAIELLLAGRSRYQWAKDAGLPDGTVRTILGNLDHTQLRNRVHVAKGLGLDLESFFSQYNQ